MSAPDSRVVVFDVGNVLVQWDPLPAIAAGVGEREARAFLAAENVSFLSWNMRQDEGRPWDEAVAWLAERHPRWAEHGRAYRDHFDRSLVGRVPGTAEVLRGLRDAGVRMAALTNWSGETFPAVRERFEEVTWFEDVVVSGDEGVAKPDPRIFALVERRLGVPASSIVFTDDSEPNVVAAREAGWDAVRFTEAESLAAALRERGLLRRTRH